MFITAHDKDCIHITDDYRLQNALSYNSYSIDFSQLLELEVWKLQQKNKCNTQYVSILKNITQDRGRIIVKTPTHLENILNTIVQKVSETAFTDKWDGFLCCFTPFPKKNYSQLLIASPRDQQPNIIFTISDILQNQ